MKTYQVLTDESIEKIKEIILFLEVIDTLYHSKETKGYAADLKAIIADVENQ